MAKILLATENADIFSIFSAEIEGEGYDCPWRSDGQDAYDSTLKEQPDAVLLDVALDIYDGFECCSMLREDPDIPKELPIIILSDDAIHPKLLEQVRATCLFPKTHLHQKLIALLIDLLPPESIPSHIGL